MSGLGRVTLLSSINSADGAAGMGAVDVLSHRADLPRDDGIRRPRGRALSNHYHPDLGGPRGV